MRILIFGLLLLMASACKLTLPGVDQVEFADPVITPIAPGLIDEASGIVDSRSQPGNLWVQEDSGNPAELTLLGHDGKLKGRISVPRFLNIDWEELANGPGPQDGVNYLYIGDIGNNDGNRGVVQIYRLPEPTSLQTPITQVDRFNFRYPDGPRDAEAMFVDPATKDIYIISKREPNNTRLYRLRYPQNRDETATAEALGEMPSFGQGLPAYVTGAAISSDGSELIVRTYSNLFYWKRKDGQSIADALQKGTSRTIPYRLEPQGEAVCFNKDGRGYFTLSERSTAASVNLYYYPKK